MSIAVKDVFDFSSKLPIVDIEIINHFKALPTDYWDFISYKKKYTQNIHTYPAMMIPPISKNIIEVMGKYQPTIHNLFDPFLGSGTVLLEGLLAGMNVWGIDLNPLALLITKAKCTPIQPKVLEQTSKDLIQNIESDMDSKSLRIKKPNFYNIDYWFKDYVIRDLQIIKNRIKEIKNPDIRVFYLVVFSQTVRDCSNTRNSEFKLYRMAKNQLKGFNPNVLEVFKSILGKSQKGMKELYGVYQGGLRTEIIANDTRDFNIDEQMDLLITSPPYGDSRTTVAYGQFSRLSLQWLDLKEYDYISNEINKERLDKYLLGGMSNVKENNLPSENLREILKKIAEVDEERALEVLAFHTDLDKCLRSITKHMKINSYQFWVVGNRTVRNINIPLDRIISELGEQYNLKTVMTIPRNISSKRMPKKNSPTNKKGEKITTMNTENIVVLRRVR